MTPDRTSARSRVGNLLPDLLATGTLLVTSLVIAWPVLQGGQITYIDNPAHLAEAHSLAHDAYRGWSEAAYCGFPLGTLHSPLWYAACWPHWPGWGSPWTRSTRCCCWRTACSVPHAAGATWPGRPACTRWSV